MSTPAPAPTVSPSAADLSRALRRRWWLVVLVAVIGTAVGVVGSIIVPAKYAATVTLVVQLPKGSADTEALVRTVEALTTSSVVLGDIASSSGTGLSARDVDDRLQIDRPSGSAIIEVSAVDSSRSRARALAARVVPSLQQRILESRSSAESSTARIAVESFGGPEVSSVAPPLARNGLIGLLAGFALGLLLAVLEAGRMAEGAPPAGSRSRVWPRRDRSRRRPPAKQ